MDYNTQRSQLRMPEHGRNIQSMVDHVITIKDREERNRAAHTVIQVMGSLNPSLRENRDFRHKLWDHLHMIADFLLDIDAPFAPPLKEKLMSKPLRIPYPQTKIKIRHYGKVVEKLIQKAIELPDGEKKDEFVRHIANHMKLSYMTWNKDGVNDHLIINSLKELSSGVLELPSDTVLIEIKEPLPKPSSGKKKRSKSNHKSK